MLMRKLGQVVMTHRRAVLAAAAILLVVCAVFGIGVEKHLSSGGFVTWSSESATAIRTLDSEFHSGSPNILFVVTAKHGTVDEPEIRDRALALTKRIRKEPDVSEVTSYWEVPGAAPLRGKEGKQALILLRVTGEEDRITGVARRIGPIYNSDDASMSVRIAGPGEIFRALTDQAHKDLTLAEIITMPVTLVLLLLVFGSAVAAGLPLGIGILSIVVTFAALRLLAVFTDISVFALNITSGMGLGLAVDYSLFVLSRYREELARDPDETSALLRTMHTAGRTVAFSAGSVAVAVATLVVFPIPFLRSFAYAGIAVVIIAGLAAVIVLPAILATLGTRVNKWSIRKTRETAEHNFWFNQAHRVMRHPFVVSTVIIGLLIVLGLPFLRINLGLSDDRALSPRDPIKLLHDELRSNFEDKESGSIPVVASNAPKTPQRDATVDTFAKTLSLIPGVGRVDASTGFYLKGNKVAPPNALSTRFANDKGVWWNVVPDVEPISDPGEALVHAVRAAKAPYPSLVGGVTGILVDTKADLSARLPLAFVILNVATLILMFLMVGSILVPIKSVILNLLSLSASFGAMVWIFQSGHFSGLLGFTKTDSVPVYVPIALFCIAFGLSQDYEVFLLSRVKEHYDLTRDNEEAVAHGLQMSGRIISALAVMLILVFAAFATAQVEVVKVFGVTLAIAIVVDAFIIRVTLAPALMRIAGHLNWWAPRSMRRFHLRYGLWEDEPLELLDIQEKVRSGKA